MKKRPAEGIVGHLVDVGGTFVFRIYRTPGGKDTEIRTNTWTDYALRIDDLKVMIFEPRSVIVDGDDGKNYLLERDNRR